MYCFLPYTFKALHFILRILKWLSLQNSMVGFAVLGCFLSKHPWFSCPALWRPLAPPTDESAGAKTKILVSKLSSALFFLLISCDWFLWELRWTFLCSAFYRQPLDCIRSAHGSYYKLIRTPWEVNKRSMTNCVIIVILKGTEDAHTLKNPWLEKQGLSFTRS